LCTYRDPDLPPSRFGEAIGILEQGNLRRDNVSNETLGLAGAIYKYQWMLNGSRRDLERSLYFYERGVERVEDDQGYTAINAAFVLDVLSKLQRDDAPDVAGQRKEKARVLRERIVAVLPGLTAQRSFAWLRNEYWFYATLAEACFGLLRHDEARYWLREGLPLEPPEWELESTSRQLVALADAQEQDLSAGSDAYRTLRLLVGDAPDALRAMTMGKVGIALSGGGFRASFFHIGVLARLAELDVLRHVDVLSCVSGGSIIGAQYYLEVRRLVHQKPDRDITRADYLDIIRRLERDFMAGVRKNIRTRLFAGWWANLWSLINPHYTRTVYLGNLLERHLYRRVDDGHTNWRRWLDELRIRPQDGPDDFNPKLDNWRRSAKAPILLLNATTLNTGHNWQFAVSWMGEPPMGTSSQIDQNDILRRMYYREAPLDYQKVRLGQAVAASACVPSLFDPVQFDGLFPDPWSVRLVDGGVHDNQGVAGLLEQQCTVLLVSDASGQTNAEERSSAEVLSAALRTNNILMARVREAQLRELEALNRSEALRGFVFLHLKRDLDVEQLDWIDCQDPYGSADQPAVLTSYGIPKTVQQRLAGVRTDLDSFSQAEAYALMLSGYRMARSEIQRCLPNWPQLPERAEPWRFLDIEGIVTRAPGLELAHATLLGQLSVSAQRGFKVWRLVPALRVIGGIATSAILLAMFSAIDAVTQWPYWKTALAMLLGALAIGLLLSTVCGIVGGFIWLLHRWFRPRKSFTVVVTGLLMVTIGWALARAHLWFFDPLYWSVGKIPRPRRPVAQALP
jgi:predicted acylesterase/phospholipase RssA